MKELSTFPLQYKYDVTSISFTDGNIALESCDATVNATNIYLQTR